MKKIIFQYETETIEVTVTKSKRKSLSIAIQPDGNLLVKAPFGLTNDEILKWVKSKTGWIIRQREKVLEQQKSNPQKRYVTGERFSYLGQDYELEVRISDGRAGMVGILENKIVVFSKVVSEEVVEKNLISWYVEQAKIWIPKRVRHFAGQMGERYKNITIKNQKKRWGSCSSDRNLNFNWRLMMMPEEIIDYVVVHELCHLKQMNHSKVFWDEVEKVLPDYKIRKKWLDEQSISL
ncbi:MAG: M48 family metallopeptidase [Lachnospiraceae bacterium]|nr:M48 family metallopeptidase [Lachnospiraceae bacterium]